METINRVSQHTSHPISEEAGTVTTPHTPVSGPPPARAEDAGANRVEQFIAHVARQRGGQAEEPRGQEGEPALTAGALAFSGKAPGTAKPATTGATAGAKRKHTFLRSDGKPFRTSRDGTPMYLQNDRTEGGGWGATKLGTGPGAKTIGGKGCAVSSIAMALSKLSGQTLTPGLLDAHLDANKGYKPDEKGNATNNMLWGVAGKAVEPPIGVTRFKQWDLETIDVELAAGRPVVLGVDYQAGGSEDLGTDHWVCLTRHEAGPPDIYYANDPATGGEIRFEKDADGRLVELQDEKAQKSRGPYKSSGEYVRFKPKKTAA